MQIVGMPFVVHVFVLATTVTEGLPHCLQSGRWEALGHGSGPEEHNITRGEADHAHQVCRNHSELEAARP